MTQEEQEKLMRQKREETVAVSLTHPASKWKARSYTGAGAAHALTQGWQRTGAVTKAQTDLVTRRKTTNKVIS